MISMSEALERILRLAKRFQPNDLKYITMILVMELGVPTHIDGFQYLVHAVPIYYENPTQSIMKDLYSKVAEMSRKDVTYTHVEQAIRNAIKIAWKKRHSTDWEIYFPDNMHEKPSNVEFISRITRLIELWQGCCERYEREVSAK